ncbi:MoaD family protein [Candidatus Bathyarchaeota archaeon]|nr:MoaD family protein [Candidatus Bathyarchaeota archaeon]
MAKILIRFLAHVKEATGKELMEISVKNGETIEQILYVLCEKFGDRLKNVLFKKDGAVAENLIIFVNGKNVMTEKGLKTTVNDGDQLMIFTPIAGG